MSLAPHIIDHDWANDPAAIRFGNPSTRRLPRS